MHENETLHTDYVDKISAKFLNKQDRLYSYKTLAVDQAVRICTDRRVISLPVSA